MKVRDAAVIAQYELSEAIRSRRFLVLCLLYIGGSVAGSIIFIEMLRSLENTLAETLGVAGTRAPGTLTQQLIGSPDFVRLLERLVDDHDLAQELVTAPPLALFYGWLSMAFIPTVVVLTASETIAAELGSGAARFSFIRVDRLGYSVGKFAGQVLLMMASVLAGSLSVYLTGALRMSAFDAWANAHWLFSMSTRAWLVGFAYVGLSVGVSHITRSVPVARALGLLALFSLWVLGGITSLHIYGDYQGVVDAVRTLLPGSHKLDLWRPALVDRLPGSVMLAALGAFYFAAGFLFRSRRDA